MTDLDTLKTVLRGLVVSNPGVMTVEALRRDYRTSEGVELPYRALGFNSPAGFLSSLKDTLRVRGNNVYIVSTEETAHLESLIARQKKGKRKGKPGGGLTRRPTSYSRSPRFTHPPSSYSSHKSQSSFRRTPSPVSRPCANRIENVRGHYNEEVRSRSPDQYRRPNQNYDTGSDYDSEDDPYSEFEVVNASKRKDNDADEERRFVDVATYDSVNGAQHEKMDTYPSEEGQRYLSCSLDVDDLIGPERVKDSTTRITVKGLLDDEDECCISPKMRSNLREIIEEYPSGLWCARLQEEYLFRHGVPLDCRQHGFVSVHQMALALPDIFRCVRVNNGDWKLFDARYPPPEQFLSTAIDEENGSSVLETEVSSRVLERIASILSTKPRGVNLNDFSVNYLILYETSVMDEVVGFKSIEELFKFLNNSIVVVKELDGEITLYPISSEEDNAINALPENPLTWEELDQSLPPNACRPNEKCPQLSLPAELKFGEYAIVRLGEIYNPWKFWVHLNKREYSEKLDKLMDRMQVFYAQNGDTYSVPDVQWMRGQHCVTRYCNEWHRVVILRIVDKDRVKVKYYDYGTIGIVPKTELRLLDREFVQLPMQAIKAKLSAIRPANGKEEFSQEANKFFFNLINGKKLVAVTIKINHDSPFMAIVLIDTMGGDDVHINDELVSKGYAEFSSEQEQNDEEWLDEPEEPDYTDADCNKDIDADEAKKSTEDITNESLQNSSEREKSVLDALAVKTQSCSTSDATIGINNETAATSNGLVLSSPSSGTSSALPSPAGIRTPSASSSSSPNQAPKVCRPPPGFKAVEPHRAPPGIPQLHGPNMYYTNKGYPPTMSAGPPGIPMQVSPGASYNNMTKLPTNVLPFSQLPSQFSYNPVLFQQMLMGNLQTIQQWPVNAATQWNPAYSGNPYVQYSAQQHPANSSVFPSQYSQPVNHYYLQNPVNNLPVVNNSNPLQNILNNLPVVNNSKSGVKVQASDKTTCKNITEKTREKAEEEKQCVSGKSEKEKAQTQSGSEEEESITSLELPDDITKIGNSLLIAPWSLPSSLTPPPTPPLGLGESGLEMLRTEVDMADLSQISICATVSASEHNIERSLNELTSKKVPSSPVSCAENESPLKAHLHKTRSLASGNSAAPTKETIPEKAAAQKPIQKKGPVPKIVWQPLDVGVGVVHILKHKDEAYVSTEQVARVCLQLNGHGDLVRILEPKKNPVPVLELLREDNAEFFDSLDLCPGLSDVMRSEGKLKLNVIPLKNVVTALLAGNIKVPKVVFTFQSARRDFNPDDDYWKGVCPSPAVSSKT